MERLGYALEPHEPYEVSKRLGGGVEDPRVAYLEPLRLYVMTYTAFTPHHPRIALAVSRDLIAWKRLGPLRFATGPNEFDLNSCGNKDGLIRISQGVHAYLKEKNIPHVWNVDGHAHDPTEWRNNLYYFLQRVFR